MSDEPAECPLCMEVLELDDHGFFPCTCGYQICRFCWHRIRTDENGLCPACRKQYPEDPAEFKPLTEDELQNIRRERKQKDVQRKQKAAENRKHLANVRVVQKNLVFVVGLSPRLADPDVLKKNEYFGKFGKIHKVVINQSTSYAGSQGPSASAYVTYVKPEDALRAILTVNNVHVDGRTLKTSLGTTKYCSHFLKGSLCQKNDCMYLHELGQEAASFTKDEMQAGKHQEYEQRLVEQFLNSQNSTDNHHVITNNKLKKNISQQVVEKTDVIPSLMDMAGDIKQGAVHPHPGPLLPNPGSTGGTGGVASSNGISSLSSSHNSAWPLLERSHSPGHGRNKDKDNNNKTSSSSSSSSSSNSDPPVINSSNHTQNGKSSHRSNTPPGSGGGSSNGSSKDPPLASSNPVGTGRQKPTSSTSNSVDDNLTSSQASSLSSSNLSSSPDQLDSVELLQQELNNSSGHTAATNNSKNSTARGLPLPTPTASSQTPSSPRAGGGGRDSTSPVALIASTMNGLPTQQPPMPQDPQQLVTDTNNMGSSSTSSSSSSSPSNSLVSAIGSSRTLMTDPPSLSSTANINSPPGLSFFSNNSNNGLLGSSSAGVKRDATLNPTPDLPNLSLSSTSQELSDSLPPISSDTDWSAAFGFKSNKDFSVDDDLGFDPCAESFKGLADLIEKETSSTSSSMLLPMENGLGLMGLGVSMQQHQQQLHHHHSQHNNLHSPQQNGGSLVNGGSPPTNSFLPPPPQLSGSPLSHQQQTSMSSASHHLPQQQQQSSAAANPAMSRLPPGFSMSHIQQQQQMQHLYRPDLAHSKMLDYLNPQFGAAGGASHHQRFSTLHGYHSMPLDLHTQHQQQQQTPSHQLQQRDGYNMKDMQEQLRSLLPNINISFGASPQQQSQQQQQQQTQQLSSSLQLPQQQSQVLNKSWPLSSSPDTSSPWNDPAIVSTSQLPDHAEHAPHWLKSLQQLTETDGPSSSSSSSHTASSTGSRLPFVQQFPMAGTGGWPTHTLNPPPGFRMNGMSGQPNTESAHQMAEVLQ